MVYNSHPNYGKVAKVKGKTFCAAYPLGKLFRKVKFFLPLDNNGKSWPYVAKVLDQSSKPYYQVCNRPQLRADQFRSPPHYSFPTSRMEHYHTLTSSLKDVVRL